MASYLPYTPQHHVNNLLTYFPGGGPQDGAHGVSWDYIPDEDILIEEPHAGQDLRGFAVHMPLHAEESDASRQFTHDAVCLHQGDSEATFKALAGVKARREAEAEAQRIAAEIRRLCQELESNPRGRLERYRPALALAAAKLLVEVETLAGSAAVGAGAAYEAVD